MTPDELGRIARAIDPEHRVFDLYDRLIVDNDRIGDAAKHWKSLTRGQQLLVRLAVFDMEVRNGGVEQYFWNRPDQIFEIHALLESLNVRPLTEAYEGSLQELLDLQAFDAAYYAEWDGRGTNAEARSRRPLGRRAAGVRARPPGGILTTYVAFLRAINVGGHAIVKMTDLRDAFAAAGCRNARTLIQSGNVVFEAPAENTAALFTKIRAQLRALLDEEPDLLFRTGWRDRTPREARSLQAFRHETRHQAVCCVPVSEAQAEAQFPTALGAGSLGRH